MVYLGPGINEWKPWYLPSGVPHRGTWHASQIYAGEREAFLNIGFEEREDCETYIAQADPEELHMYAEPVHDRRRVDADRQRERCLKCEGDFIAQFHPAGRAATARSLKEQAAEGKPYRCQCNEPDPKVTRQRSYEEIAEFRKHQARQTTTPVRIAQIIADAERENLPPDDPRFEWIETTTFASGHQEWVKGECKHLEPVPVEVMDPVTGDTILVSKLCLDCDRVLWRWGDDDLSEPNGYERWVYGSNVPDPASFEKGFREAVASGRLVILPGGDQVSVRADRDPWILRAWNGLKTAFHGVVIGVAIASPWLIAGGFFYWLNN